MAIKLRVLTAALLFGLNLIHQVMGAPDNDNFTNRIALTGTDVTFRAYRVDATSEPGEPNHAEGQMRSYHSIWWSWTAPADGFVDISGGNSLITVYTGESLETLHLVTRWQENIRQVPVFGVESGKAYQIVVSTAAFAAPPMVDLQAGPIRLQFYPPSLNDQFAQRPRLEGASVVVQGYTAGATREAGEPSHGDQAALPSVWWEWTPPVSGIAAVRMKPMPNAGSFFFGSARLYRGSQLDSLTPVPFVEHSSFMLVTGGEPLQVAAVNYLSELAAPFELSLTLSTLRIVSPEPGVHLPAGPLKLTLENVSPAITRLYTVINGQYQEHLTNATELIIPTIDPGKHRIRVVGVTEQGNEYYSPEIEVVVQAGSDAWSQAPEIPAAVARLGGDFSAATYEAGELKPDRGPLPFSGSVWWRWTAPALGRVMVGGGADTEFFKGPSLATLQPVPFRDEAGWENMRTAFLPQPGTTYWLRMFQTAAPPYEWGSTIFAFQPRATNDDFAKRIALGAIAEFELAHEYATYEPNEQGPVGYETGSRWYSFTAPEKGVLQLQLESWWSMEARTSLMVFTGSSRDSLSAVAGPERSLGVNVNKGVTYHVRVQIPNDLADTISIHLKSTFGAYPPNDNVADATVIPLADGTLTGTSDQSTKEPGETLTVTDSVWYRFTAPEAGVLAVTTRAAEDSVNNHITQLGFLTGSTPQNLQWVERQDRFGNRAVVDLAAGETILVLVWSVKQGPGPRNFVLEHQFITRPPNDQFSNALTLVGAAVSTRGTNWFASREANEPSVDGSKLQRSIWWKWTAPADGILEVQVPWGETGLFVGEALTSLVPIPRADTTNNVLGGLRWAITNGVQYHLAVDRTWAYGRDAFETNALSGFELSLRLGSVSLATPTNLSRFGEGQPVPFALNPVNAALDGTVESVSYKMFTNVPFASRLLALGTVTAPPYQLTVPRLSPGYHQVQAVATNVAGEVILSPVVALWVTPANDDFAAAQELVGRRGTNTAVWSGATVESGEPTGATSGRGSVWYRWQSPATGILRATGAGLGIYAGTNLASLKAVPQTASNSSNYSVTNGINYFLRILSTTPLNDVGARLFSTLRFELNTASLVSPTNNAVFAFGQNVPLRLDTTEAPGVLARVDFDLGTNGTVAVPAPPWEYILTNPPPGSYTVTARPLTTDGNTLTVTSRSFVVAPANDHFTNQVTLAGEGGTLPVSTRGASSDLAGTIDGDIWFEWTAPADGLLFVRGPIGFSWIELYTGTNLATLERQTNRLATAPHSSVGEWLVSSNATYRLGVFQSSGWVGAEFDLKWIFERPPANDRFADRIALSGESGEEHASLVLATVEPGELDYGTAYPNAASVWWTWTPPRDGLVEIGFPDNDSPPTAIRLAVGSTVSSLVQIPPAENLSPFNDSPRHYRVTGGVPVHLVYVSGYNNVGDRRWTWKHSSPPENDNFARRKPVANLHGANAGTTLAATREPGEPGPVNDNPVSVWWTFTAPTDGDISFGLESYQTHNFTVWAGSTFGSLRQVDSFSNLALIQGETIHVQIVPREVAGGPYALNVDFHTRATNDDFAQRERVEGTNALISGANWRSTREFGEPIHANRFGSRSVWYAWRAPRDGEVTLHPDQLNQQFFILAAYEGDTVANLEEVASVEIGDRYAPLRFHAQAGHDYALVVDGASAFTGEFKLELNLQVQEVFPTLQLEVTADGQSHLTAPDIAPGVWDLEESFDLKTWYKVENVESGPNFNYWLPYLPERERVFHRLRRLD